MICKLESSFSLLVSSGFSIYFNNSRKNFLQMVVVSPALVHIHSSPKVVDSILFGCWLDFSTNVFFKFMPKIFDWVHIRRFSWSFPPINVRIHIELLNYTGGMFWVIILHELVGGWEGGGRGRSVPG